MSFITRALRPLRRPAPPPVKSSDVSYGMYLDAAGNLTALKAGSYTNELAATRNITGDTEGLAAAYMASVWAYRCVNVRAQAVSRVPFRVFNKKTGDEIPGHPLTRAILTAPSLLRRWEWSLGIWGETFVELMRNRIGNVAGLKWLNPLGVVVDTTNGQINQFQYSSINGGRFVTFEPQEIVFSRFDNPVDDLRGMSPFITVLDELGIDRAMSRVIRMYYANDTRLGMLLIPDRDLTDADQQKFMAFWNANYKGSRNAGKAALMPFGLRAERVQNQPNEDDTNLRTVVKQEVCAAFGVPAILVGTGDVATYQNTDAQMQFFSENTVIPECLMIAGDINRQALPYFDNSGETEFEFIIDDILALSDAARKKADMQNSRLATGGITLNEYRESLGMKPIPTGEVLYVPSGSVPIPLTDLGKPLMAPPPSLPAASPFGLPQLPKLPERTTPPAQPQQPDRPAEPTPTGKADKYDPSQRRDDSGRWSETGAGGNGGSDAESQANEKKPDAFSGSSNREYEDFGGDLPAAASFAYGKSEDWANALDEAERDVAHSYVNESYQDINAVLRGQVSAEDVGDPAEINRNFEKLDAALRKGKLDKNRTLYRGLSNSQFASSIDVGDEFTDKAYSSTTLSSAVAENFADRTGRGGGVIVKIKARQNQPGGWMGAISDTRSEAEFLLPRNTKFRVTKKETKGKQTIVEAEIIDDRQD